MKLLENYLQLLNTNNSSQAKEWRGSNIPYGDDSNRPNLVRECMTLESDKMKINCLRKLKDQVAMNPQYRDKIDRWVDAITDSFEPSPKEGTPPGNELTESNLSLIFEKEWDEKNKWDRQIQINTLRKLLNLDPDTNEKDLTTLRHSMQPTLLNLIKNTGGDWKGNKAIINAKHGDYSGIKYILKHLPKDWEDKIQKYVRKISNDYVNKEE